MRGTKILGNSRISFRFPLLLLLPIQKVSVDLQDLRNEHFESLIKVVNPNGYEDTAPVQVRRTICGSDGGHCRDRFRWRTLVIIGTAAGFARPFGRLGAGPVVGEDRRSGALTPHPGPVAVGDRRRPAQS